MANKRVFLDTSVLFSTVHSETGGARQILKLGEAGVITLWVGPTVIAEADAAIERKSPASKGYFALLLDRAGIQIGPPPEPSMQAQALAVTAYASDAAIVAEALAAQADYLVSLDRQHLVGAPSTDLLPFPIGTPGDFLAWLRGRL